jgi:hypothetical protein
VATNLAIAIANDGVLGSPFSLHRLSRAIGRLPGEAAQLDVVRGAAFLVDVCRALFVSRNPRVDYFFLRNKELAVSNGLSDVFSLCGRAIGKSVFLRDWDGASSLFDLALHHSRAFPSSQVTRAVIGLKERFLLLPHSGTGVRDKGDTGDLLWTLNHAEQRFCQGDFSGAQTLAESVVARQPAFGWGRLLLVRILFCQGNFQGARSVLLASEIGSIGVAEELAWTTLIPGAEESQQSGPLVQALATSHFRLPYYFESLSSLLRGETKTGLQLLKTASRSGEPSSFMVDHDPVIRMALQGSAHEVDLPPGQVGEPLQIAAD